MARHRGRGRRSPARRRAEAPAWLRSARRRARPALSLSLAWNPQAFSSRHSLADWMTWVDQGLVDELVVLIDRWGPQGLAKELVRQQGFSGSDLCFDDSLRPHPPLEP